MNKKNICKNCKLFKKNKSNKWLKWFNFFPKEQKGTCMVNAMYHGEHYELKTKENDSCHWENIGADVKQIAVWSDGVNGFIEAPIE